MKTTKTTYIIQEASKSPHGINYYDCPDTAIFTGQKQALKTLLYLEKFAGGYRYRLVKRVETIQREAL
jgi:hypothetical protein